MLFPHRALIESEIPTAIVMGTAADGVPSASRGAGAILEDAHTLRVSLADVWSAPLVVNIEKNRHIAVSFTSIETYQAIQCKGTVLEVVPVEERDRAQAARAFKAMAQSVEKWMPTVVHMVNRADLVLRIRVTHLFDQTPGPGAGQPIP